MAENKIHSENMLSAKVAHTHTQNTFYSKRARMHTQT